VIADQTEFVDLPCAVLQRMTGFDDAGGPKDMDFVRQEVAKDFVERWLNVQPAPKIAEAVNRLTKYSGRLRAEYVGPILQKILGGE
jgi:hypothetical protein